MQGGGVGVNTNLKVFILNFKRFPTVMTGLVFFATVIFSPSSLVEMMLSGETALERINKGFFMPQTNT